MGTGKIINLPGRRTGPGARNLKDKGGRRSGPDRRRKPTVFFANDRRQGIERRSGRDRRCFCGFTPQTVKERRRVFLKTRLYWIDSNRHFRDSST
jgi:hypothetical protein